MNAGAAPYPLIREQRGARGDEVATGGRTHAEVLPWSDDNVVNGIL
jgi:hypothetical protein